MEKILAYLQNTYAPHAVILYGSYADGTQNEGSDLDALLIADGCSPCHDVSVQWGVQLDVFVYPTDHFLKAIDLEEFVQVQGGRILRDDMGYAARLMEKVEGHLAAWPKKAREENEQSLAWCEKMVRRAARSDAEGYFRWHWLLTDSLEIYCDICGFRYIGPKKTLLRMQREDGEAYDVYARALGGMDHGSLAAWIVLLKTRMD